MSELVEENKTATVSEQVKENITAAISAPVKPQSDAEKAVVEAMDKLVAQVVDDEGDTYDAIENVVQAVLDNQDARELDVGDVNGAVDEDAVEEIAQRVIDDNNLATQDDIDDFIKSDDVRSEAESAIEDMELMTEEQVQECIDNTVSDLPEKVFGEGYEVDDKTYKLPGTIVSVPAVPMQAPKMSEGKFACDVATDLCKDDLFINSVAEVVAAKLYVLVHADVKVSK